MRYAYYSSEQKTQYPIALLVPTIRKQDIAEVYDFENRGVLLDDILVLDLHLTPGRKKPLTKDVKQYTIEHLVPTLTEMGIEYVLCAQADYFKVLTGVAKIEPNMGYVLDSKLGNFKVIYLPNYRARFYNPERIESDIEQAITALNSHRCGVYTDPGAGIVHFEAYPQTVLEITEWLDRLLIMDVPLTIDTENFSLKHFDSGLGTISFAWNQHEGIAFAIDYVPIPGATTAPFGRNVHNEPVRALLRRFFRQLSQKAIYHNISYDAYILIYQLFMADLLDTEGLLEGMDILLSNWDCTKLITYLATNSCAGNKLGLKDQAQEFAGNYAQEEIKDITRIKLPELLRYNLIDACSTWYVHNKHYSTMVADDQLQIYEEIFQPAILDIVQMQLTGLPVNMETVVEVKALLEVDRNSSVSRMNTSPVIIEYIDFLNRKWVDKRNNELKKKRVTLADAKEEFNPNSNPQLQELLYEILKLPVIELTDSKAPAADGETLKNLKNHTDEQAVLDLLDALIDYKSVDKILTSFIPAFERSVLGPDGWHYMFGNFNLGGTLSGRLSSSDPNLQNLPASSKYAKLIKRCVEAPPGWIFGGLDFDSLEDKISAVTTKDPNKIKVYTDGYDGHSLRAYSYFKEQMPDIDGTTVEGINAIAKKYGALRGKSKAPTFALTYQGTKHTLMNNCGFDALLAQQIFDRYQEMYRVSIEWVDTHLDRAMDTGYVTAAFGLRVRTPLLKQVIRGTSKTPYEAEAEGRSAGNALGQSWCLLNNRAASDFMSKVRQSKHRLNIKPCAHIHDAQYYLIRDDVEAVRYTNENLVEAVYWQDHPDIYHPEVKLGGALSIFYPTWKKEIGIPHHAKENEIFDIIDKALSAA
jgi:DNA polymerase-1